MDALVGTGLDRPGVDDHDLSLDRGRVPVHPARRRARDPLPAMSKTDPWHGHSKRPELSQKGTSHPRCGHFCDNAKSFPFALVT